MADEFTREDVFAVCAALPATTDETPFGPETSVYKVVGKVFAITNLEGEPVTVTIKADPPHAEALVREHDWIKPGYHMNKRHWVTVLLDGSVPDDLLVEIVTESHRLVAPRIRRPRPAS